jgi:hypothetical protein
MGNNLPSALYGVYRVAFGYSSLTQTALYAAAIAVIVLGLVVFGPLSDVNRHWNRTPYRQAKGTPVCGLSR